MSNEFDYSGLYHNNANNNEPGGEPAAPQGSDPEASAAPQGQAGQSQPEAGGYPNVGSSGMNTANTARTDFSQEDARPGSQTAAGARPDADGAAQQPGDGYTSTMHGGAAGGYSYASAPTQPPKKQKGKGKKIALRVVAGVAAVAVCFGSGMAGAVVASRAGLTGSSVVLQTVERDTTASSQGSTGGTQLSTQDVASLVSPSVVVITTEQMVSSGISWFGDSYNYVQSGAGSGVIISQDGYILTCAHVIDGASNVSVQLYDSDQQYTATVVGSDSVADIAVLKIDATGLTPAVIGDSDSLAVGEEVIAVGNPLGTLGGTVTNGIISALNRQVTVENTEMTLIQTNAAVSPGNSGGGLFNANGELIGIVNAKSDSTDAEGLGFAIPINTAVQVAQQLIDNGYVPRPALGVVVITISDQQTAMQYNVSDYGVYIAQVNDGSGAAEAGLQPGDRIVSIGDVVVSSSSDLTGYLQNQNVGDTVTIQVERDGSLMSFDVTLGSTTAAQ